VKLHAIARGLVLAALLGALSSGSAEARNEHCSGGIQYVVQAMRDKDKGNTEDYQREIGKAIQQFSICVGEDPNDFEAVAYMGWAYAEAESACAAGNAFAKGIAGLHTKGDAKKEEWATNNRNSYWAKWFNDGIAKVQTAQQAYADFCKKPDNDADVTLHGEAEKNYQQAESALMKAWCIRRGDPQTARNLATVYALQCQFQRAEGILNEGLQLTPTDSTLKEALRVVRVNVANKLVDEKKFDEALAIYAEIAKSEPNNPDPHMGMADIDFRLAQGAKEEERSKYFRMAGEEYSRASDLKATDADLAFNSALSFQNAKVFDKALPMWERTIKLRPEDVDALSAMGDVLVELKRCGDAVTAVHKAVTLKPENKILHRQLGSVYTRCGNNPKGTEELMVFLALSKGQAAADAATVAKAAKQGTDAAKTLASEGVPEQVYEWTADDQKWETWFYWTKKHAYHFGASGALSQKSDWTAAVTAVSGGTKK
jgi:tetratricopeptide (TPR) repeat protein